MFVKEFDEWVNYFMQVKIGLSGIMGFMCDTFCFTFPAENDNENDDYDYNVDKSGVRVIFKVVHVTMEIHDFQIMIDDFWNAIYQHRLDFTQH